MLNDQMVNNIIILSKNNTFAYLLNDKDYNLVISKFNMHLKKVDRQGDVLILKSSCFNSTYLKNYIQRIVEE